MFLQRKLRAMYAGDEKFRPEQMPEKKWLPVIGFTTKRKQKVDSGGKQEVYDEPYFVIIGNNGMTLQVIAFNCKVMIDERAEIDTYTITQIARNLLVMGKVLCEKLTGIPASQYDKEVQEADGKKPDNPSNQPV